MSTLPPYYIELDSDFKNFQDVFGNDAFQKIQNPVDHNGDERPLFVVIGRNVPAFWPDSLSLVKSKQGLYTAQLVDPNLSYVNSLGILVRDPYTVVFTQEKNYVMKEQVKNSLSTGDDQLILDNDTGGNGKLTGNKLDNIIQANLYDNTILGKDGDDLIKAGAGQDSLTGDKGSDTLFGEAGNDTLNGGIGYDRIDGGTGNDILDAGASGDFLDGGEGKDFILGGEGEDSLVGGSGKDTLDGGSDDDSISGGAGSDKLLGGLGSDTLNGDESNDTLTSGKGNDIFEISSNSGNDYITDFNFSSKTSKKGVTTVTEEDQIHVIGHKDANGNFTLNDFFVEEAFDATLITFKDGGSILLKGITAADNLYFNEAEGYFTLNSANAIKVDFTE